VINKEYPLYKQRGGDLLYMLETGLLEEMKPGPDEDKTVEEYHSVLNEALFVATGEFTTSRRPG
jgi:hypothetical protein